jgi:precorrin-6B methylase 1
MFVFPSHEAIRRARREDLPARMLPAVSALDCLMADLGVDVGETGCLNYEANDFLVHRRPTDPTAALVLWQVGAVGATRHGEVAGPDELAMVANRLSEDYPTDHEVVVYEASPYPIGAARVRRTTVGCLAELDVTPLETLYIPPVRRPVPDPAAAARLRR